MGATIGAAAAAAVSATTKPEPTTPALGTNPWKANDMASPVVAVVESSRRGTERGHTTEPEHACHNGCVAEETKMMSTRVPFFGLAETSRDACGNRVQ